MTQRHHPDPRPLASLLVLLPLVSLVAPRHAQEDDAAGARYGGEPRDAQQPTDGAPPLIARAGDLVGRGVYNDEGLIGRYRSVCVRPDGRAVFAVVEVLRSGLAARRYVAVPHLCLTPDAEDEGFYRDVSTDRWSEIEGFDPEQTWPEEPAALGSGVWCAAARASAPARPEEARAVETAARGIEPGTAWRLHELVGRDVTTPGGERPGGERLGEVGALGFDVNHGRVDFFVLSADQGSDLVAVPWKALSLFDAAPTNDGKEGDGVRFVLDVTTDDVERAPEFDAGDPEAWARTNDPEWAQRNYERYGVVPYWTLVVERIEEAGGG